jgi:hypothetical protein
VRKIGQALKASDGDEPAMPLDNSGPLARVLHTWHVDPRFIGEDGLPLVLPFDEHGLSFSSLVRAVAGDVPAGAVRAELKRAGAIAENDDGFIQRFAFSESLSVAAAALFRHWARAESTRFIEAIDNWLATNEGAEPAEPGHEQKVRAGVGVFYYEGPSAEEVTKGR